MATRTSDKARKIVSALLAAILAVIGVMSLPLAQAHATGDGTLTVEAEAGHFTVYRLIHGDSSTEPGKLKNCSFDDASAPKAFWEAVDPEGDFSTPDTCAAWLDAANSVNPDVLTVTLARAAVKHATPCAELEANESTILSSGYYLVLSSMAHPVLTVVDSGATATVVAKHSVPVISKHMQKVIDGATAQEKISDAKTGDDIVFQLESTFPSNLASFDKYAYSIADKSSEALVVDASSVKVSVLSGSAEDKDVTAKADISYDADSHELLVSFDDIKPVVADTPDPEKVVVTYSCSLTRSAPTGFANPTFNNASVTFSTSPTSDATGTNHASSSVASEFVDATHIYTFGVRVHLTDKNDSSIDLVGASFVLQDGQERYLAVDGTWHSNPSDATTFSTDERGMIELVGVDADTYVLTQSDSVDGYVPMADAAKFSIDITTTPDEENLAAEVVSGEAEIENIDPAGGIVTIHVTNAKAPAISIPFVETGNGEVAGELSQMGAVVSGVVLLSVIALIAAMIYRRKSKKNL